MSERSDVSEAARVFYGLDTSKEKERKLKEMLPSREAAGYLSSLHKAKMMNQLGSDHEGMTRSRFQNCFYYFRGPSAKQSSGAIDQQLEDNATKALINVLEHSERPLTSSFLSNVVGHPIQSVADAEYRLQGGPSSPSATKRLVGLSLEGRIDPNSWSQKPGGSRVDGTIHVPGSVTVFLETKVVPLLDGSQLRRHAEEWEIPMPEGASPGPSALPAEWVLVTWADVHDWSLRELSEASTEPTRFLISQLVEFLELAGLAPTWVLRPEHFTYLRLSPESRDPIVQSEVKARLGSLWAKVEESLGEERFRSSFGETESGTLVTATTVPGRRVIRMRESEMSI